MKVDIRPKKVFFSDNTKSYDGKFADKNLEDLYDKTSRALAGGESLFRASEFGKAREVYENTLSMEFTNLPPKELNKLIARGHILLGNVYRQQKEHTKAYFHYTKGKALDPNSIRYIEFKSPNSNLFSNKNVEEDPYSSRTTMSVKFE